MTPPIDIPYGYRFALEAAQETLATLQQRKTDGDPRVSAHAIAQAERAVANAQGTIARYEEQERTRRMRQQATQAGREAQAQAALEAYIAEQRHFYPLDDARFAEIRPQLEQEWALQQLRANAQQVQDAAQRRLQGRPYVAVEPGNHR